MVARRWSKVLGALTAAVVGLALMVPLASAGAVPKTLRPDPGFGSHGVVEINSAEALGAPDAALMSLTPTRRGAAFAVVQGFNCTPTACGHANLVRYTPKGVLDPRFLGAGAVGVADNPEEIGHSLLVDGKERAIVPVIEPDGTVVLHRYLASASVDASFGAGGAASFACGCQGPELRATFVGQGRIAVAAFIPKRDPVTYEQTGTTMVVARFLADGKLDRSFGSAGVARVGLPLETSPEAIFGRPSGAVYFGGRRCCSEYGSYLSRVSAKGVLDTRFGKRTTRVFNTVKHENLSSSFRVEAILLRPHGRIDVFGASHYRKQNGFAIRFKASGDSLLKFGTKGLRRMQVPVATPVLDGSGGTFALLSGETILRLTPSDAIDRSFGEAGGIRIPQGRAEGPQSLALVAGGKLMVSNRGETFCRYGGCEPKPTLSSFLIVPRHRNG